MSIDLIESNNPFCMTNHSFVNLLNTMTPITYNHSFDTRQAIENHPALNCLSDCQMKDLFTKIINVTDGQESRMKKDSFYAQIEEGCCSLLGKAIETYERYQSKAQVKLYQLLIQYTKIEKSIRQIGRCETMDRSFSSTASHQSSKREFPFAFLVTICPKYPIPTNFSFDALLGDENNVAQIKSKLPKDKKLSIEEPNCLKGFKCFWQAKIFEQETLKYIEIPTFIDEQLEAYEECDKQLEKTRQQRCRIQTSRNKKTKTESQNLDTDFETKFLETEIKLKEAQIELNDTKKELENARQLLVIYNEGFRNITNN